MISTTRTFETSAPRLSAFPAIDRSAWLSGACYLLGFHLAVTPAMRQDILSGGAGAAIMVAGVVVFFVAVALIQRHMSLKLRASTFGVPRRLVTDGVFRLSRNPIYVAFLLPLLTFGYYSWLAALLAITVYVVGMTRFVIAREERHLATVFGSEYAAYFRSTPRWLIV